MPLKHLQISYDYGRIKMPILERTFELIQPTTLVLLLNENQDSTIAKKFTRDLQTFCAVRSALIRRLLYRLLRPIISSQVLISGKIPRISHTLLNFNNLIHQIYDIQLLFKATKAKCVVVSSLSWWEQRKLHPMILSNREQFLTTFLNKIPFQISVLSCNLRHPT